MATTQEPNGTWSVQAWYRDYYGKRRHKTKRGFASNAEAQRWENEFLTTQGTDMDMTMDAFVKIYEKDIRPRIRENTWYTKESIIENSILPYFGRMRMGEIDGTDVMRWQNQMMTKAGRSGKPYSPTYLRTINNQLSAIFNHAVRYYDLPKSPCIKTAKIGSKKGGEMLFWTKQEYNAFADAVMDKPEAFHAFEILYWCGLRLGEMLALTPADFDFEANTLSVTKSYQRLKGRDVITDPKTPKSVRSVALPRFVADEMREYIELEAIGPGERVFGFTKHFLAHEMDRGCKASGVKRIRVHDLRHSHVSLLIDMGFSAVGIAERMGHESTDITFRYAHLFPDKQNEMARALDADWRSA